MGHRLSGSSFSAKGEGENGAGKGQPGICEPYAEPAAVKELDSDQQVKKQRGSGRGDLGKLLGKRTIACERLEEE